MSLHGMDPEPWGHTEEEEEESGPRLSPRGRLLIVIVVAVILLVVAARWTNSPKPHPSSPKAAVAAPELSTVPSPGPSPTVRAGESAVDPGTFAAGACIAFPPANGNRNQTVFLDAGHGGPDPGAQGVTQGGATVYERNLTLPVVMDTVPLLRAQGYRVVVSRTTNSAVAILTPADLDGGLLSVQGDHDDTAARAQCADAANASVLVSVHFNAGSYADDAGMLTAYDAARSFTAQNLALANLLQTDVLAALNANGAGIPNDGLVTDDEAGAPALSEQAAAYGHLLILGPPEAGYFTTASTMPGALIEPLFLTDPFEASIADSSAGQHEIAAGIARAVEAFLGPGPGSSPAGG
ncbi:MAG TPA: N-acetylmuramoyl-L-alanine amidase [Actinomycetota bacterium]|nr:N-acetylmuramoyl-L-alanine amidase [Actinomycetota bacterium]